MEPGNGGHCQGQTHSHVELDLSSLPTSTLLLAIQQSSLDHLKHDRMRKSPR